MTEDLLARNLACVRERILLASGRAGRKPGDVLLVAVTKSVGPEVIRALARLGVTDIGENRVQDASDKQAAIADFRFPISDFNPQSQIANRKSQIPHLRWHMIGHLQTNKARLALRLFDTFHSVDSLHVAEALAARHVSPVPLPILIECNVSGEAAKFGVAPDALPALLDAVRPLGHLRLDGLMTMAPWGHIPVGTHSVSNVSPPRPGEASRPVFAALRELAVRARARTGLALPHLSMGMTQDFEVAVEEGATMVRIGTALFEGM